MLGLLIGGRNLPRLSVLFFFFFKKKKEVVSNGIDTM